MKRTKEHPHPLCGPQELLGDLEPVRKSLSSSHLIQLELKMLHRREQEFHYAAALVKGLNLFLWAQLRRRSNEGKKGKKNASQRRIHDDVISDGISINGAACRLRPSSPGILQFPPSLRWPFSSSRISACARAVTLGRRASPQRPLPGVLATHPVSASPAISADGTLIRKNHLLLGRMHQKQIWMLKNDALTYCALQKSPLLNSSRRDVATPVVFRWDQWALWPFFFFFFPSDVLFMDNSLSSHTVDLSVRFVFPGTFISFLLPCDMPWLHIRHEGWRKCGGSWRQ